MIYSIKRKRNEYKPEFIKQRDDNTSKIKFRKFCDKNNLEDCKIE